MNRFTTMPVHELRAEHDRLVQQHSSAVGRIRALRDRCGTENRDFSAAEAKACDTLMDQAEALQNEIDQAALALRDAEYAGPDNSARPLPRMVPPEPVGSAFLVQNAQMMASQPIQPNRPAVQANGFKSLGEFLHCALRNPLDRRLHNAASTYGSEGIGQDGGFAVPSAFSAQLMALVREESVFLSRSNIVPTSGPSTTLPVPAVDRTGNKRGGLQLLWSGEGAGMTEQKPALRELAIPTNKASVYVPVTDELLEDAPAFQAQIGTLMQNAIIAGVDDACMNGSGVGKPLGILSSPALITVAKESGQAASTLLLQNLANMVGKLAPGSFGKSIWLIHPTLIPLLYGMSYTVKNVAGTENVGGSHVQAVTALPDGSLSIYGRPTIITDACSVLSAAGDIVLADLSQYVITWRTDIVIRTSVHEHFGQNMTSFRATFRMGAQPEPDQAIKLKDGTTQVSPFVALGAR